MIQINAFLSAYDPSDLPGESIDPLGFERGYLHLAEKILPSLTNVANRPRYFGVLCAGIQLANISAAASPRQQYEARLAALLRLERLWALANVLVASEKPSEYPVSGIRGLRYVQRKAAKLIDSGATRTQADFQVLARQATYGVVGIYGAVSERLRFLHDRKTLTLTPDAGLKLADAFIEETSMPAEVKAAVQQDRDVSVRKLMEWGERAHITGEYGATESQCLTDALHSNPIRSRMVTLLEEHLLEGDDSELDRLARIEQSLIGSGEHDDLRESIAAIVAFERAYALAQLGLERMLWYCRSQGTVPMAVMTRDEVLRTVRKQFPAAAKRLDEAICGAATPHFRTDLTRLEDVRCFVLELAALADAPPDFVRRLLQRHADVQFGKLDRGRRKAPWIETVDDALSLTMSRIGGAMGEITSAEDVTPHFYRTDAAEAMHAAGVAA